MNDSDQVKQIHALNIDSSKHYLFPELFNDASEHGVTSEFVDSRQAYYARLEQLAHDKNALYYVVGSDEFLLQNITLLHEQGIPSDQIKLDKHERRLADFLELEPSV